ncbi:polysaccharide deacetylase family protein [candidate division KSB1 bacterium]|nr:polysaccharide deacetylase family protein [candidate division KSB1 bacterium]
MNTNKFWTPYLGAVSLTFDDGTRNQLELALPALDKYNLKATFYIVPNGAQWEECRSQWERVGANGHEIANHTLSHICSNNFLGKTGGLEDRTLAEIEADILAAQQRLEQIAPHQKQWTFAYPCYNTDVGRGMSRQSYIPLVARHFIAGRAWGEHGFANQPEVMDLAHAGGIATERMSGHEMIGLVEALASKGQWLILVFHQINGSRLSVGSYDFSLLLEYLHSKRSQYWTAPVVEVAQKIAAYQAANALKF